MGPQSSLSDRTYDIPVNRELFGHKKDNAHCFWTQSGSYQENFSSASLFADCLLYSGTPFDDFHLDASILLRAIPLTILTVMVHTWLSVFGTVDSISLSELDLAQFIQLGYLPSDESVVIRISFRCRVWKRFGRRNI